jgi:hypothetical protein
LPVPDLTVVAHEGKVNDLKFGDPLEAAQVFGRPTKVHWIGGDYCVLTYADAGMEVHFQSGRFEYLALMHDRHVAQPDIPFKFARATVRLAGGVGGELSRNSTIDVIESHFGRADRVERETDESIYYYHLPGVDMEFEVHPTAATLMRWNLYPKPAG